ncbi:hypothetical protein ACRE_018890 [Hapsidospora chrysogenum ATCC 11550]|uniref:Uncharacterized protein n=1 Tax=Hapsidospora chrysogenum (strain ATCC 11550 / CBS 779.69 / DSM 880 / IAM 14645 / JCM 23072 / IMI 49137) TaxID=857340 RepID=A0A086TD24_HAPC1|nr:hypothetical protein ACRE_018890 [Hapsidospora chrysogenum ATCC 11550]
MAATGTILSRATGAFGTNDKGTQAGIIIFMTLVSITCLAVIAFLLFRLYKRRQYSRLHQSSGPTSGLGYGTKPMQQHWKQNQGIADKEELERLVIIRKSLASRTSARTDSRTSSQIMDDDLDPDTSSSSRPTSLRDDWKEYEANIHRERSASLENHPILKNSSSPRHPHESLGRPLTQSPLSDRSSHYPPSPLSARSSLPSPLPVASRSVSDSARMLPPRGTFDAVPEEYCNAPLDHEKSRGDWV